MSEDSIKEQHRCEDGYRDYGCDCCGGPCCWECREAGNSLWRVICNNCMQDKINPLIEDFLTNKIDGGEIEGSSKI